MERLVYAGDVDLVLAPALGGQLGILPHHTPLIALLDTGELVARTAGQEDSFAISGGFMEVLPGRVVVFAEAAEAADDIDLRRAEAARERAARLVRGRLASVEAVQAEAALRRSLTRIRVARRKAPRVPRARSGTLGDD